MDRITKSPGLRHILEEIFVNLDYQSLLECEKVDLVWKELVNSQRIWIKKEQNHSPSPWLFKKELFEFFENHQQVFQKYAISREAVKRILEEKSKGHEIKFHGSWCFINGGTVFNFRG